jgi:hypothetical protein
MIVEHNAVRKQVRVDYHSVCIAFRLNVIKSINRVHFYQQHPTSDLFLKD